MIKSKVLGLDKLSHAEKILVSFYRVSKGTTERIPYENIVLQAWRDFPIDFSLPNFPKHPDSYVISKRIYSDLITSRLVVSLKNKTYRLTEKGVTEAQKILETGPKVGKEKKKTEIQLNRDEKQFLDNALRSKTFMTWKQGKKDALIDYDVRVFFQFSTGTPIKERYRRAQTAEESIKKAIALNLADALELRELYIFLVNNFPQLIKEK